MRFLRNPIVTGILALIAVVVVAYQFKGTNLHLGGAAARVVNAIAPPPVPPPPAPAPATTQLAETSSPAHTATMDRAYLEARFARWVASPQRDPFLLFGGDPKDKLKEDAEFQSPISKWRFNAVWDQTDSRLAVINNRVYRVNDEIEGYKIIRIDRQEVWFQGPKRKERLALLTRGPEVLPNPTFVPADTNPPPAEAVPSAVPQ